MPAFKSGFDPLDLEIIDRVYEVAWAHIQACQPNRNTASDGCARRRYAKRSSASHVCSAPGHVDFTR